MRKDDTDSDANALIEHFKHLAQECASAYVADAVMKEHNVKDRQWDLSVRDADYESSASYACQKSWTISSTLTEQ